MTSTHRCEHHQASNGHHHTRAFPSRESKLDHVSNGKTNTNQLKEQTFVVFIEHSQNNRTTTQSKPSVSNSHTKLSNPQSSIRQRIRQRIRRKSANEQSSANPPPTNPPPTNPPTNPPYSPSHASHSLSNTSANAALSAAITSPRTADPREPLLPLGT